MLAGIRIPQMPRREQHLFQPESLAPREMRNATAATEWLPVCLWWQPGSRFAAFVSSVTLKPLSLENAKNILN